jgi:hypothetical protein
VRLVPVERPDQSAMGHLEYALTIPAGLFNLAYAAANVVAVETEAKHVSPDQTATQFERALLAPLRNSAEHLRDVGEATAGGTVLDVATPYETRGRRTVARFGRDLQAMELGLDAPTSRDVITGLGRLARLDRPMARIEQIDYSFISKNTIANARRAIAQLSGTPGHSPDSQDGI